MIQTVSVYDFRDAFLRSDTYKHNFTYDALTALFEYQEDYEGDQGQQIELDMISICCDYAQYDSALECVKSYQLGDDIQLEEHALEILNDHTQVIEFEGGIIIQQF